MAASVKTREEILAVWTALFEALRQPRRSKYRGREIGVRGVGSATDTHASTPGRLGLATRTSVERFLETKALRDAKRTRVGVRRILS